MKSQKGFTLIELVVAIALVALVALAAAVTIWQMLNVSAQNSHWNQAIRNAQNVGYWVSHDSLTAETIRTSPPAADNNLLADGSAFLVIYWKEWVSGDLHRISYTAHSSSDSLYKIERTYTVFDQYQVQKETRDMFVADNINYLSFNEANTPWLLEVTADSGSKRVTRTYEVKARID